MSSTHRAIACTVAALAALLTTACQSKPTPAQPAEQVTTSLASNDTCQPLAELGALDQRRPVPLLPRMAWHQKQNMLDHLVAIERIVDGVAREDWEAVQGASARIESSRRMRRMCNHMGAGAEGFTEQALEFHRRADAIGEAARAQDAQAVLRATSNTLQSCTSCHAQFRQDVVDADTWMARTGQTQLPPMRRPRPPTVP